VTHNRALGQRAGVPAEKFQALAEAATSPRFSDVERRALRYAEEMTVNVQVNASLVEALRRDLGEAGLVQLTLSIAAANFTTRFNEALGTDLETRTATPADPR
jgi:alkylhydroperoxidase family enzyme